MVKFFKKVFSTGKGAPTDGRPASGSVVDEPLELPRINQLIQHYPIGEKVRYYPEFQKDGALDTLILGYSINGYFVYSPMEIRSTAAVLRLFTGEERTLITELESFSLLIPFNPDDDNKRDYVRRAELGPRGPFRRHNTVTLTANSNDGVLCHLDTLVRKIMPVSGGIYAGHQVVLLDVIPSTLALADQRQHYRLNTCLPATLSLRDGGTYACTLRDFAEQSVQLNLEETAEELEGLSEFRRLTLCFDLGSEHQPKCFELDGSMYRKSNGRLVMKLQGIYKNGKLENLGLVDILDIKASLLRHPATQAAVRGNADGM
ncbi:MAG: hypothetical protein L3K24_03370 [Gammaproteobacteria bacterium]|nr:hypothetical protein [Gammaproteobacteria bacterium]